jgi:polyisoprenoid-binding protein YceI
MGVCYRLDAGSSRFTVQAFAAGLLSFIAHNPMVAIRDFTGELRSQDGTFASAAVQVTVKAESLTVVDNVNPRDRPEIEQRMRTEVPETALFPEIRYQSQAAKAVALPADLYRLAFQGQLFLHGVTGPQTIDTQVQVAEETIRLRGAFTLLLSAYRIRPVTAVGGTIRLKDELKFAFDILGRRADPCDGGT